MPGPKEHDRAGVVCVVHQQDGTDVRVGKLCRTLSVARRVCFLGWARDGNVGTADLGQTERRLFARPVAYGPGALLARLMFIVWVVRQVAMLRPATVVAVNEELGFPLSLMRPLLGFSLVIDIHDPLADRVASERYRFALRFIQDFARNRAKTLIVTDQNRYARLEQRYQGKATIIPNYPNRPRFDLSSTTPVGSPTSITLAVVGSLHSTRGLRSLRAAIDACGQCTVEAAGWIADDEARHFCALPYVNYRGVVGQQDSLQLMASCDAVFCFYEPSNLNNLNASPNKIYEAICLGKRSIINSEVGLATWVVDNGFGYSCAYGDSDSLAAILRKILLRLPEHRAPDPRLIAYAESRLYWELAEEKLRALV